MKIAVLSNQSQSTLNFWKTLISSLQSLGADVVCITPAGDPEAERALREAGAGVVNYSLDRKGLNPFRDYRTFRDLRAIFAREKPDLVFATTIKPVIYGAFAANAASVPAFFATITGLGYAFEADTPLKKILNKFVGHLYKRALAKCRGVFFQNRDDAALFRSRGILAPDANVLFANGTGVDTARFTPSPLPNLARPARFVFLLVARLLEAKGIKNFVEAAEILKKKYPDARFILLGPKEKGPGAIGEAELCAWQKKGLEYAGSTRDVLPWLTRADVVVLPSWREGVPTSLMEAMSCGRPCVATDVPGCREAIRDGATGILVPPRDSRALAEALEKLIENPDMAAQMGVNGRAAALENFDAQKVAAKIIADMRATAPDAPWPEEKND